jgi:hypothetical protein
LKLYSDDNENVKLMKYFISQKGAIFFFKNSIKNNNQKEEKKFHFFILKKINEL